MVLMPLYLWRVQSVACQAIMMTTETEEDTGTETTTDLAGVIAGKTTMEEHCAITTTEGDGNG